MVYFLQGVETGKVKVGVTGNLKTRLNSYRTHASEPIRLLAAMEPIDDYGFERRILDRYKDHITHGEWFTPPAEFWAFLAGWKLVYGVSRPLDYQDFDQATDPEFEVDASHPDTVTVNGEPICQFSHPTIAQAYANHMNMAAMEFSNKIFEIWERVQP